MSDLESAIAQVASMTAAPRQELARIEKRLQRNLTLAPSLRAIREATAAQLRAVLVAYDDVIDILNGFPAPEASSREGAAAVPIRALARLEDALAAWSRLEKVRAHPASFAHLMSALQYVRDNTAVAVASQRRPAGTTCAR